jgi:hypothetical protein
MDVLDNVLEVCGANPSGTAREIFFAPLDYFETIQKPVSFGSATEMKDILTIAGTHVFKEDKGFHKIQVVDETGNVQSNAVGEKGGRSFEHMVSGFVAGNSAHNLAVFSKLASCPYIFIVQEYNSEGATVYRQIGSENRPGYNVDENNYNSGTASADRRGLQFTFKSVGNPTHAPFYEGTLDLFPEPIPEPE